jgi:peptidoglycan biosynthesis protein MviN/MurJ (putative lipid II flippase)
MAVMHNLLVGANGIIIAGGSLLAGGSDNVKEFDSNRITEKIMRTVGQSIFLLINTFLLYCILDTIRQARLENPNKRTHPTLLILLAIWPCLIVRGLYGILSGVLPAFNYFNPDNYGPNGLTDSFIASEYVMGTTMEWASCSMLLATYFTSRDDPKKAIPETEKENKELVTEA